MVKQTKVQTREGGAVGRLDGTLARPGILRTFRPAAVLSGLVLLTLGLSGCDGGSSSNSSAGKGQATVLISGNSNATSPRAIGVLVPEDISRMISRDTVDVDDIESLWVTITEITLDRVGNPTPGGGNDDDEDDVTVEVSNHAFTPSEVDITVGETVTWVWTEDGVHTVTSGVRGDAQAGDLFDTQGELADDFFVYTFQSSGVVPYFSDLDFDAATGMAGTVNVAFDNSATPPKITVFRGALRVNLKDLSAISEILSVADIPAGRYNGIRLSIEDPELVLVGGDPENPITEIQLTANGRLFIKEKFEVVQGENILIIVDFGSIHLVEKGNGGFVLTPQLRVILDVVSADVAISGMITAIDPELKTILVLTGGGSEFVVDLSDATVITYSDDSAATFGELAVDQLVEVEGNLNVDNTIDAESVEIQLE